MLSSFYLQHKEHLIVLLKLLELVDQDKGGDEGGDSVGYGDADPDTQCAEELRKDHQARYQEK